MLPRDAAGADCLPYPRAVLNRRGDQLFDLRSAQHAISIVWLSPRLKHKYPPVCPLAPTIECAMLGRSGVNIAPFLDCRTVGRLVRYPRRDHLVQWAFSRK